MDEYKIIEVDLDSDNGAEVRVMINGEETTIVVQLSGGDYLSQMGGWITRDGCEGDDDGNPYRYDIYDQEGYSQEKDHAYDDFIGDCIAAAEKSYKAAVEAEIKTGDWKEVETLNQSQVSATATDETVIQYSNELDEYRWYLRGCGFIGPNDYATLPDFELHDGFATLEDAIEDSKEGETT